MSNLPACPKTTVLRRRRKRRRSRGTRKASCQQGTSMKDQDKNTQLVRLARLRRMIAQYHHRLRSVAQAALRAWAISSTPHLIWGNGLHTIEDSRVRAERAPRHVIEGLLSRRVFQLEW